MSPEATVRCMTPDCDANFEGEVPLREENDQVKEYFTLQFLTKHHRGTRTQANGYYGHAKFEATYKNGKQKDKRIGITVRSGGVILSATLDNKTKNE